jgi:hypothetical protein
MTGSIPRLRRALAAALLLVPSATLTACDSPTPPRTGDSYALVAVNGELPGPYPDPYAPPVLEATGGTLTLYDDATYAIVFEARCAAALPPGTQCSPPPDGRIGGEGSYDRSAGTVQVGDREYAANFSDSAVTLSIAIPPSQGFFPSFTVEFRR